MTARTQPTATAVIERSSRSSPIRAVATRVVWTGTLAIEAPPFPAGARLLRSLW
jgi:hypothetical protein